MLLSKEIYIPGKDPGIKTKHVHHTEIIGRCLEQRIRTLVHLKLTFPFNFNIKL